MTDELTELTKTCTKCGKMKPLSEFYKAKGCVLGVRGECKPCTISAQREHKKKPEVMVRAREYFADYRKTNADKLNARTRERYASNDNGFRDRRAEYRNRPESKARMSALMKERQLDPVYLETDKLRKQSPEYKTYMQGYRKNRYDNDQEFRFGIIVRSFVKRILKITGKKSVVGAYDIVGYDAVRLRSRLECQFTEGMSWNNHGEWHIDHKKPVSAFIRQGITDPRTINMLCNLQPMWATDNLRKKDKWVSANDNGAG